MKNREKLMRQSVYDTILTAQRILEHIPEYRCTYCVLDLIDSKHIHNCATSCDTCIGAWLNEDN